jgi:glucose/arabinose dehydrogenase
MHGFIANSSRLPGRFTWAALLALAVLAVRVPAARATSVPTGFQDQLVAGSLVQAVGLAEVPDPPSDSTRRVLFVEQRSARVGLVLGGAVLTVGTVPGVAATENERGLLGIAVDPGWPARPWVYVYCTDGRTGHTIAISRFTLTGDLSYTGNGQLQFAASSRYDLRRDLQDTAPNHNGGTLRFGTDGYLYASLGDDASGCPARDSTKLVGKILRLDVSRLPAGAGGPAPFALLAPPGNPFAANADSSARLVWTLGLRNPFRFQVDSGTGALFIADVGENAWEELDRAATGGLDMGWPTREGPDPYSTCVPASPRPVTGPIASYAHPIGEAITAGPCYRRPASGAGRFPAAYDGNAFYLDYYSGFLWRIVGAGASWSAAAVVPGQGDPVHWGTGFTTVSDMIELSDGTIWYVAQFAPGSGVAEVHRLVYSANGSVPPPPGSGFALSTPWPSPAHDQATIAWTQPAEATVQVTIHDIGGRLVRTLVARSSAPAGPHQVLWDGLDDAGRRARPGVYAVRVRVGDEHANTRVVLAR